MLICGSDLGNTVTVKTQNIQNGRSSDKYGNLCMPFSIFIFFLNPYTIYILYMFLGKFSFMSWISKLPQKAKTMALFSLGEFPHNTLGLLYYF